MYEVYISFPKKLLLLEESLTLSDARKMVDFLLGNSSDLSGKSITRLKKVLNLKVEQNYNGTISVKYEGQEESQTLYIQRTLEKN